MIQCNNDPTVNCLLPPTITPNWRPWSPMDRQVNSTSLSTSKPKWRRREATIAMWVLLPKNNSFKLPVVLILPIRWVMARVGPMSVSMDVDPFSPRKCGMAIDYFCFCIRTYQALITRVWNHTKSNNLFQVPFILHLRIVPIRRWKASHASNGVRSVHSMPPLQGATPITFAQVSRPQSFLSILPSILFTLRSNP